MEEADAADSRDVPPAEMRQSEPTHFGQNLQIVDCDEDEEGLISPDAMNKTTVITPSAAPSSGCPSRYPRRDHRPPTRYNDFVPLNCIDDGTSS